MPEPIEISFADFQDAPALVQLIELAYRGPESRAGWTTEADLLDGRRTGIDEVASLFYKPGSWFLLGHQGPELVACAHLQQRQCTLHFGMFAVRPQLQNLGYGKHILQHVESLAREHFVCNRIEMLVIQKRESLIAWYERRGFTRTHRCMPFPYGDLRFGQPKEPDLEFEVLRKELPNPVT